MVLTGNDLIRSTRKYNLVDLRMEAGFLTQQEFAQAAGLARSTVTTAENSRSPEELGKRSPISRKSAWQMVKALRERGIRVDVEDIDWITG